MLLLDHNLPHQLRELLADFGIEAETARYRGWAELRNGELTLTSYQAGFRPILTRDVGFATSASKSIAKFLKWLLSLSAYRNEAGGNMPRPSV